MHSAQVLQPLDFFHVVNENILIFELKGVDLFLMNEEMAKYVTCKFIQHKVDYCNFNSFTIQK